MKVSRRTAFTGLCSCLTTWPLSLHASAQTHRLPFCGYKNGKGWYYKPGSSIIAHKAKVDDTSGIPSIVNRMELSLNFSNAIDIYITRKREGNTFATVANGNKLLIIDPNFLEDANVIANTDWAAILIIAHEVGHHIAGFIDDAHQCELNADYWSGQILQRLGASPDAAKAGMIAVGNDQDTDTHPNKWIRADTIVQGWTDGNEGKIDYTHCVRCEG